LNNNSPHLGYRIHSKKGNSRDSKANSKQALVHWLKEITKAKLSQAKFGQVWTSLGQVESIEVIAKLCKWEKRGRKNKKKE